MPSKRKRRKTNHVQEPASVIAAASPPNDANVAIAVLSLGIDGMLLFHKVMCYLAVEDHIALFQTCTAFRRILATETGPSVACLVFPQAVANVVRNLVNNEREYEMRTLKRANLYVHPLENNQFKNLIHAMAINTSVAAAVLLTACSQVPNLFLCLCKVWRSEQLDHYYQYSRLQPLTSLWQCSDDEMVLAAMKRKRKRGSTDDVHDMEHSSSFEVFDRGANPDSPTASRTLCAHHCQWLESVLSLIFAHPAYEVKVTKSFESLVYLANLCRNPRFIATHLLGKLERSGVLSACPSALPPLFDSFPQPPQPQIGPISQHVHLNGSGTSPIGTACLQRLWHDASSQQWDPLLDHLLLRYRLPDPSKLFREACSEGRTALAMRILEVRGASVDPAESDNTPLRLAIDGKHEETVQFLLWIGRKAMDNFENPSDSVDAPPWLQYIRYKLEESARWPSTNRYTLRVTLSGIRTTAHYPVFINPVHRRREPIRQAASKGTLTILNLLAHAAGGWHALSRAQVNGTEQPIVHLDLQVGENARHRLRGLEDLLWEACQKGEPATVRFLVSKIRHSIRAARLAPVGHENTNGDPERLFVRTLSECLLKTCHRPAIEAAAVLDICRCLLFESVEDEASPPSKSDDRLVASPAIHGGQVLLTATDNGHEAVVSLLLSHVDLPATLIGRALVRACVMDFEGIASRLLALPDIELHGDFPTFFHEMVRLGEYITNITGETRDDGAARGGHLLVTTTIILGHTRALKVLLDDPRIDPGSALTALKLACKSKKLGTVVEVLSAKRYAEVFQAWREGGDPPISLDLQKEIVAIVTKYAADMAVNYWENEAAVVNRLPVPDPTLKEKASAKGREIFDILKRLLMTGWVQPLALKFMLIWKTKLQSWHDAVDLYACTSGPGSSGDPSFWR
ncbi:hypothetical protein HDU96_007449 [Phlyctochytrium bullatum]|nr:hypothetical protein HDU96_007449 [Phlyctochytrium bullatum]